jgi:hypothetical protein
MRGIFSVDRNSGAAFSSSLEYGAAIARLPSLSTSDGESAERECNAFFSQAEKTTDAHDDSRHAPVAVKEEIIDVADRLSARVAHWLAPEIADQPFTRTLHCYEGGVRITFGVLGLSARLSDRLRHPHRQGRGEDGWE